MKITFIEFNKIRNARGKEAARFDIVDDDGEVFELRGEERFSVDLARLKKERSLFLTAGPNTKTQNVVAVYDRLLQMRFRKVYLAAPAASPVE